MSRPAAATLLLCLAALGLGCGREPPDGLAAWLQAWEVARACLVPAPGPDVVTGVAMGELGGTPRFGCQRVLLEVVGPQPEGEDEPRMRWRRAMDLAHLIYRNYDATPAEVAHVIAQLDAEVPALRRIAGLPAVMRHAGVVPVLPPARPLLVEGRRASRAMLEFLGEKHGVALEGRDLQGETTVGFIVRNPDEVDAWQYPTRAAVGHPTRRWFVTAAELGLARRGTPLAALEAGGERIVVSENDPDGRLRLELASTRPGGWRTTVFVGGQSTVAQDTITGVIDVGVETESGTRLHRIDGASQGTIGQGVLGPPGVGLPICVEGGRSWFRAPDGFYRFDGTRGVVVTGGEDEAVYFAGCRGDLALAVIPYPARLRRCDDQGCRTVLEAGRHQGTAALDASGRWLYAAEVAGVVAVRREGRTWPSFHRLASAGTLVRIAMLASGPHLVIEEPGGGLALVALPSDEGGQARPWDDVR